MASGRSRRAGGWASAARPAIGGAPSAAAARRRVSSSLCAASVTCRSSSVNASRRLRHKGSACERSRGRLDRAPSTISRELRRNVAPHDGGIYDSDLAHARARERASRRRVARLAADDELRAMVQEKLELEWSPEQISAWLRLEHPDERVLARLSRDDLPGRLQPGAWWPEQAFHEEAADGTAAAAKTPTCPVNGRCASSHRPSSSRTGPPSCRHASGSATGKATSSWAAATAPRSARSWIVEAVTSCSCISPPVTIRSGTRRAQAGPCSDTGEAPPDAHLGPGLRDGASRRHRPPPQ